LSRIEAKAVCQTGLIEMILPASVEFLGEECFFECTSLSSITFESGSRLSRIEANAFYQTGLIEIILPALIEVLGEGCFSLCKSLSSITFESGSRLSRIEAKVFAGTRLVEIILPASIEFLGEECFLCVAYFPRLHLNPGQDFHELKRGHSLEPVWLKSFFLID
jgi:hypothetical protein